MTFREKSTSKLYAFAMAAVFALVLAGCGGGGGGATDTGGSGAMPTEPPTEAQKLAAAKTAAMTAYEAAKKALDAVMDDASHDTGSYGMAQDALNEAKAANAVAQAATTSAAAEDAQALVETARDNVMKYAGMVTAAAMKAAERVKQVAANKVAMSKETAIAAEAAQLGTAASPDAGLGGGGGVAADGTTVVPAVATYSMTIERDSMDPATVKIADSAMAGDDDPKFMQDPMNVGVGNSMHVRTMEADADGNVESEVVFVSTDIEAPKAVPFEKFEQATIPDAATGIVTGTTTPQELNIRADGVTVTADNPADALGIVGGNIGNIKAGEFTAPAGTTGTTSLTFQHEVADDTSTTDVDESKDAAEIMGTFNGAMGTYKCTATGANCSVTVDAKGVVSAVSNDNDWVFIPDEGATSEQSDYDYYSYGFWLKRTSKGGAVTSYDEVETFARSSFAASGAITNVTGSAKYEGGATGVYVKNVYNSDRTLDVATSGHFTADVDLMVYFGGNDVAVNKHHTLTGTIDNFALSGGEENNWSVDLQSDGDPATAGIQADTDGDMSGTAKGGEGDGSFSATFHGSVAAGNDGTVPKPGSVVGEFNAGFLDGSVAGAFGAREMKE